VTHLAATKVVRRKRHKTKDIKKEKEEEEEDVDSEEAGNGDDTTSTDDSTDAYNNNSNSKTTTSVYNMFRPLLPFQLPSLEEVRLLHGRIIERYFHSELQRKVLSTPSYQRRQQMRPEDLEADEHEFFDPYLVDSDDNNFVV
jgi:hypothetical protein